MEGQIMQASQNGNGNVDNTTVTTDSLNQIVGALEIIHDPRSSNARRKEAGDFLEQAKAHKEAPLHGFTLAYDQSQPAVVRHFALCLIEHAIRYNWQDYENDDCEAVRKWIITLAQAVQARDPSYVRNKVAQLWVEVAKRSWANDWMNMDQLLVELWSSDTSKQDLCMHILESLVDDIFNNEDSQAGLRATVLHRACVDVFSSQEVLLKHYPPKDNKDLNLRCGEEGWLFRLVTLLRDCLDNISNAEAEPLAIQVISTLKACMLWSIPKAIIHASVVEQVGRAMLCGRIPIQMVATECLSSLFSRSLLDDTDFQSIVCPMYHEQTVDELRRILQSIRVDPEDIDEDQYLYLKRFSELVSNLAIYVEERTSAIPPECNLANFLRLLYEFATHDSLSVSLPLINAWARILRKDSLAQSPAVIPILPSLLEICKTRLVRYELLPEDSTLPSLLFLNEDIEAIPERHAFVGNYRRFLSSIVESMVKRKPLDGFPYILQQVDASIGNIINEEPSFQVENYTKNSTAFLRLDAVLTIVEAALKGFMKWLNSLGNDSDHDDNKAKTQLDIQLTQWCQNLLDVSFPDPLVKKKVLQLLVAFSTTALEKQPDLMLKVLEHILLTRPPDYPQNAAYSEAVKELQSVCTSELQRLAVKMPDHLMIVYDQLEMKIKEIIANEHPDERHEIAYHTFLFTINHRTSNIDPAVRLRRLDGYLKPIRDAWSSPELTEALSTFDGFCQLMGMDQVQQYLASRRVNEIQDFSNHLLDEEGQRLQTNLAEKYKVLPLRITKAFLAVSTDRLVKSMSAYDIACQVWHDKIPIILPNLLKFLSYAHAFHNPGNWNNMPPEFHPVMKRVLTDRFWQAGISSGSRDQFYENVSKTKKTMEGFASSIRGTVRMVRESTYSILWTMSRLDIHFFGFDELPGPLAHSLFADAHHLSSHQMTVLLNMCRFIIDECLVQIRPHFLTPFLATLFVQVDRKVSVEWKELNDLGLVSTGEDKLAEEMKEESVLRQLTYTAVLIVAHLLDPARSDTAELEPSGKVDSDTDIANCQMRALLLSSNVILEPLITFCTHVIEMRDSRCCGIIIRVFRSIVPEFAEDRPEIQEFICREVFMAAINSLHDDYFVDVQKDLAQLIVQIYSLYSPHSQTPRNLLLQLPGLTERRVEIFAKKLAGTNSVRVQRSLMLELLDGLRGVAVSEKGRVSVAMGGKGAEKAKSEKEKERKAQLERVKLIMERNNSPDLGGMADMFG